MDIRPNIIFYFVDQQRADTCGCYGQPLEVTPVLDQLAEEGVVFENAFTPQPVCGPCRAIFQTGKYATELGCQKNDKMLPDDVKTIADYFEEAGYETAYVGKWHLASDESKGIDNKVKPVPSEFRGGYKGFWRVADVLEFTSHGYDGYVFDENNNKLEFKGYRADCITDFALEFFERRNKEKPFFLTISHIEPHHQNDHGHYEGPIGCREEFADFVLPGDLEALEGNAKEEYPDYLGQIHSLDKNLGRLIETLKETGIYDNTIIVYASDHGSHFKTRNHDNHLMGYDDYKRTCHDAALHVPLIISGGKFRGNRRIHEVVSTESLPKTILAMAGIDVVDNMIGENLECIVSGESSERENAAYAQISESRYGRCIRTEKYTYAVYSPDYDGDYCGQVTKYADDFLYDNEKDPYQLNNVVYDSAYSDIKMNLRSKLVSWIQKSEGITPVIYDENGFLREEVGS